MRIKELLLPFLIILTSISSHLLDVHDNNERIITHKKLNSLKEKAPFETFNLDNHPFKDLKISEISSKLGLILSEKFLSEKFIFDSSDDLPINFHYKEKWPECFHEIRDQQNCGSCWAFAASEVLSDRLCIESNGTTNLVLSPQDLVSCDGKDRGCNGGFVDKSWNYLKNSGIVSEECLPYTSGNGSSGLCPFGSEPSLNFCKQGKYKKYKVKSHGQLRSISEAKHSLFNHGPIEAAFYVFDDFLSYKGGIYQRISDNFLGGHAVKVVGWGKDDDGTEYWIVANSWNTSWGEQGFFRIKFGECSFENSLWAGEALLEKEI